MIRKIGEEEVVRILNIIMENNTKIFKLQSMLVILMKNKENKNKKNNKER